MKDLRQLLSGCFNRYPNLVAFIAISALGAIAYGNSLFNGFHFDDIDAIVRNPLIRDLRNIPTFFIDVKTSMLASGRDWRPLILSSYALDYAATGLNPLAFHITNLLVHLGTAYLIFLVAAEALKNGPERISSVKPALIAAIAASVFTVHVVNADAVDYIWARSSMMSALLLLLSLYCFIRGGWNDAGKLSLPWYLAGVVAFLIGLAAKATVLTLPAMLILYEMLFLTRGTGQASVFWRQPNRLTKYIPIFAVAFAYVAFRFIFLRGFFTRIISPSAGARSGVTATTYLLTQFRAWVYYLRLFLWPEPLIPDFPGFGWSRSLWDSSVLLSLATVVVILVCAWRWRRSTPVLTFFIFWFFIALLPEASFIPLRDAVTGYRAYPAYAGLAVAAVLLSIEGIAWIAKRLRKGAGEDFYLRWSYGAACAVILCVLTGATMIRNRVWKDEMSLWSDVVAKDPTNSRAFANLGLKFMERGDYARAQELFERAVALGPNKSYGYMLRGYLNVLLDRNDQALSDLTKAIEISPRVPSNLYYRAELHRKMREYDKALADYQSALALHPLYTDAYVGMALVHMDREEKQEATEACQKLTEIDPHDARGYTCLGTLLIEQNRIPDAIRIYQSGIIHVPRDSGLWYGLGLAYEQNRMYREAGDAFERAGKLTQ